MEGKTSGRTVRVTLDRVQILDRKEPFFDRWGEVRLRARVSTRGGEETVVETTVPERGALRVAASGDVLELDRVLFEGRVGDRLEIELAAVEVDSFSPDDAFQTYRRVHLMGPEGLSGDFGPGDESIDAEELTDWRVWYRIEEV